MKNILDDAPQIQDAASGLSRRDLLKQGAVALVGGTAGAALTAGDAAGAQAAAPTAQRPPAARSMAGTRFRAFVNNPATGTRSLETLTLRAIQPHQAVIRTEAAQACYTIVNLIIPAQPAGGPDGAAAAGANPQPAQITGHGGVGVVEEVGAAVRRVQVGDRVVVPVTPNCGQCWMCLHGRGDFCSSGAGRPNLPVADMADGTPVTGTLGGFAELMIAWEEQTIPVASKASAAELSLLSCVMTTGLGLAMKRVPVEPGTDVLVLGAGPLGLSAVQGARLQGASQIIVVEPVPYRRDLAMKVGATAVLDPNALSMNDLIARIREMCKPPLDRAFAGARGPAANAYGPLFVLEAVGGDRLPPKVPAGPDPTGVQSLQLAWTVCPNGGTIRTCGVGHPMGSQVTIPAGQWSNSGKTHIPGNFAGVNTMRDIPAFARLIDSRQFDAASLVGQTFPLDRVRDALQVAADRTTISGVVTF